MPRIPYVRYTVQKADASTSENFRSEEGTTLKEMLEDDLCVTPSKFSVYVNGSPVSNIDEYEIQEGDSIKLQPKNYSSGFAA